MNFLDRFSKKSSNIKFHQNPFIGSRGQTDRQTDMTKLIVAFRNFANASKKIKFAVEQVLKAQRESRGVVLPFL